MPPSTHDENDLAKEVLAYVQAPNYQPVKPRVLAKKLGLAKDRQADLKKVVKRLVKQGRLVSGAKQLVKPASERTRRDRQTVTGLFRRASGGFGFVTPRTAGGAPRRDEDVFIPLRKTLDAADGDLVAVRLKKQHPGDRRRRGEIVEVLERETHRFVGVYIEHAGSGLVSVDGNVFAHSVSVGDPGTKNVSPGDKVVIEMVRFPSSIHNGEAVIVEVLGARGAPGVDTLSVLREFNLPDRFSDEALRAARAAASQFKEAIGPDRTDLSGSTVITIDPVDAKDFDDAISLDRLEHGHWRLGVHIADVSHFVPLHSPLDREARERATSVYLPDRVVPMLPETISNNLASLQPDRLRYTKTVFIEFTAEGAFVDAELRNSVIRSRRRFHYEEVDDFLADREAWRGKLDTEVFTLLCGMYELAMTLRRRRLKRGALELTLPEIKLEFNKKGEVQGARLLQNTESHQIIEEFMLAANEAVAHALNRQGWNFLRRIHESPDPRKLQALTEFVRELGVPCESMKSRFEIQRVIAAVAGRPEQFAVNFAVLRSMQKAVYSPTPEGHYALHSDHYCHFTSPIRRYPDLTIHRMVQALLTGKRPPDDLDQQVLLGEHCSQREQRAEQAERALTRIKLLSYLGKRIGEEMDAVVTGVERYGLFVQGVKLPAEGLVHISSMQDDSYQYDPRAHSLAGHRKDNIFRLGDVVRVQVARVDVDARELDFRLVGRRRPSVEKPRKECKTARQSTASKRTKPAKRIRRAKRR